MLLHGYCGVGGCGDDGDQSNGVYDVHSGRSHDRHCWSAADCGCMTGCECEAGGVLTDCDGLHDNHQVGGSDAGRSSLKSPAHHQLIGQRHPAQHLPHLVVYCQNLQIIRPLSSVLSSKG